MLPTPTILIFSLIGLILLVIVVYVSTGSVLSSIVVMILAYILYLVLHSLGVLDIKYSADKGLDISFFESAPAPAPATTIVPTRGKSIEQKEVFYIGGNDYTYQDAPALCAAYNAELATYDQLNQAYSSGAEWCGYGWTQGGMALYPTQDATWQALQNEVSVTNKTACGRPGINGGYFDPDTKFGVNCYGVKPHNTGVKFPRPVPGTDEPGFQNLVNKFRSMLKRLTVSPFNRDEWSKWTGMGKVKKAVGSAESGFDTALNDVESGFNTGLSDVESGAKSIYNSL